MKRPDAASIRTNKHTKVVKSVYLRPLALAKEKPAHAKVFLTNIVSHVGGVSASFFRLKES